MARCKCRPSWLWVILFAAGLSFGINGGVKRSFTLIYPEILTKYGTNNFDASWMISIFGGVKMFTGPFVSYLCLSFGYSKVTIVGGVLASIGMVSSAYAPSLPVLYVTYGCILAFGCGMMYVATVALIGVTFKKNRGVAMAVMTSSSAIGGLVFTPMITWLLWEYGYVGAMLICGRHFLHFCVSGQLYSISSLHLAKCTEQAVKVTKLQTGPVLERIYSLEDINMNEKRVPQEVDIEVRGHPCEVSVDRRFSLEAIQDVPLFTISVESEHLCGRNFLKSWSNKIKQLCASRPKDKTNSCQLVNRTTIFALYSVQMAGYMYCITTDSVFLSSLAQEKGMSPNSVTILLVALSAVGIPSRLFSGAGDIPFIKRNMLTIYGLLSTSTGVSAMLLGLFDNHAALYASWVIFQIGQNICHAQQANVLAEVVDASTYTCSLGVMRLASGVGAFLSPPISGFIGDETQLYKYSYIVSGVICIATSLVFLAYHLLGKDSSCKHRCCRDIRTKYWPTTSAIGRRRSDSLVHQAGT